MNGFNIAHNSECQQLKSNRAGFSQLNNGFAQDIACEGVNGKAILILATLAGMKPGYSPSQQMIAKDAACSVSTVKRSCKALENAGLLLTFYRHKRTSLYRVTQKARNILRPRPRHKKAPKKTFEVQSELQRDKINKHNNICDVINITDVDDPKQTEEITENKDVPRIPSKAPNTQRYKRPQERTKYHLRGYQIVNKWHIGHRDRTPFKQANAFYQHWIDKIGEDRIEIMLAIFYEMSGFTEGNISFTKNYRRIEDCFVECMDKDKEFLVNYLERIVKC